jgi:hypothetical protein
LGVAIVLWRLLNTAGQFENWSDMERIITTFVGATDSMTFGQLGGLLRGAGVHTRHRCGFLRSASDERREQGGKSHGELNEGSDN